MFSSSKWTTCNQSIDNNKSRQEIPCVTSEIGFFPAGTPTSLSGPNHLHSMEILKDCSTHELVPITPLTESIPLNSPLMAMEGVQAMPMLLPLSHLHQQQSQLVPIQIQQTQPTIMSSASSSSSSAATAVVCIGDTLGLNAEQQLQKLQDVQQSHIIPMAPMQPTPPHSDSSNGSCLTCLPELPETEDFEDDGTCHYVTEDDSHHQHAVAGACDNH